MFFLTAKAWHDSRNKSLSPTFSAGKALPKKTTPTKKATTSATKRRRTPTRKSTGGIGNSRSPSASSVAGSTPPRKSRRSVGSSAISAAKKFEFVPPVKEEKKDPLNAEEEEEEEEDVLSDSDATKELVEDLTTQSKSSTKKKVPIEPMQEDSETEDEDEEEEKEQSATKKKAKRQGGMAAIQKLREEREKKGLKVIHTSSSQKKSSPLAAATKPSQPASHTKQQQPKLKSPDPPPSSNKPPAAVAALFSKPQTKKQSAHRPGQQKYDPNQPFPTSGYKLPTAAYCGCGPTPGSGNKMSSRGGGTGTGTETTSAPDPIDVNAAAATSTSSQRSGSFTAANMKQSMQHLPPVNHTTTTTATTTATPGMLSAAISKAQFLVQSAAGENRVRRAMMGIRGSNNVSGTNTMTEEQMDDVNANALDDDNGNKEEERGRKSLDPPTIDSSSVSYSATLQKFRGTGRTSVGGDTTTSSTTKRKPQKEPEDATAATTVAGEHTSEAGEEKHNNDDDKSSTSIHLDEEMEKELSFVKKTGRVCFSIMKILMCIQLGVGFLFLVSYMLPSPSKSFLSLESQYGNVQTSTAEEKEFDCFIDYPQLNVEGYDTFDDDGEDDVCEGKYKQCPPWGRCSKGKLQDCLDGDDALYEGMVRFVVNDSGTECVISPEAKELSTLVHDAIVDMTVDQVCRGSFSATNDESYPLFSLYLVASRVKDPSTSEENDGLKSDILIWLRPVFDRSNFVRFGALSGDNEDDVDAMSLGEGMSPNSLPLPLGCKGKLYAWELLEIFCTSAWVLLAFAVKKSWFLLMTYPIYTVSAILMWQFIRLFRRRKKWNAKMKDARDTVFNLALDRLSECDHHDGWAAIMLRDDIAAYLHPTNWTERQFIIDDVWPGVRLLILADNRVRKFRKMANGRQLEHWDFAPQAKQVRKMRNSFSGSTPGSGVRNEDVSKTEQPLRRDP